MCLRPPAFPGKHVSVKLCSFTTQTRTGCRCHLKLKKTTQNLTFLKIILRRYPTEIFHSASPLPHIPPDVERGKQNKLWRNFYNTSLKVFGSVDQFKNILYIVLCSIKWVVEETNTVHLFIELRIFLLLPEDQIV